MPIIRKEGKYNMEFIVFVLIPLCAVIVPLAILTRGFSGNSGKGGGVDD